MEQETKSLSIAFLYDDTLDSSDGVAQYVKTLGSWLDSQGHSVSYLVGQTELRKWSGGSVFSLSRNLKIGWGGNRLSVPLLPKLNLINSVLGSNKFDVISVQVPYSPLMSKQVIKRLPSSTALVGTFHVVPGNKLSVAASKLLKISYGGSLARFDGHLSVSSAAQSYAAESFHISSSVVPNVVELSRFISKNKLAKNRKPRRIIFLGRLVERKGCKYLIRAFAQTQRRMPNLSLVIGGDGPQKKHLEELATSICLKDSVEFLGFVKEGDKADLLASAEIACFPSLYGESFGIVLVEAMAAGAGAVIGGNNVGYSITLDEIQEVLFNPRNTSDFVRTLEALLQNNNLLNKIHTHQSSAVKKYDVNVVGPKVVEFYREAIAKRIAGGHN